MYINKINFVKLPLLLCNGGTNFEVNVSLQETHTNKDKKKKKKHFS